MIKELFVLSKKKIFKYVILLIALCIGISLKPIETSSEYNNFYNTYSKQFEVFESKESLQLIPSCEERSYLFNHIKYLINRKENISINITMLEKQANSSLFIDDLDKINHQLSYEKEKLQEKVQFYDTYKNEIVMNNNMLIYCLYVVGIILVISIFYDDIKNGQLQIFKTYKNNLKNIFKSKLFSYLSLMAITAFAFMLVDMIQLKGNYSVYNMESFSDTFINLNLIGYVAFKYINAFVNAILFSALFMTVLLVTRNLVITMTGIFLGILVSFFAFGTIMSNLKYFNLYYFMFVDKFQYNGMNTFLNVTKLALCILFIVLFYFLYIKDIFIDLFKKSKKIILKTTNPVFHVLRELLIPSKGILVIAVVILFSVYQFNTFKITYDYKEVSYQNFKVQYLGPINEERYEKILTEYQKIQECHEKKLELEEFMNKYPENAHEIYIENVEIFDKAQKMENIARLRMEFEEALELKLDNLVDNRGANLLVMKNQVIYLIECLCILALPLIFVYMSFRKQMTLSSYSTVIKTSKMGEKKYLLLSNSLFVMLAILNTVIMIIGHIIKIEKFYPLNLSNTLKDILFVNVNLTLSNTLVIFGLFVVLYIILISRLSYFIMIKSNSNK